jgi:hypothetical protein
MGQDSQRGIRLLAGMALLFFGLILAIVGYIRIQEIDEVALLTGMTSQLQFDYNIWIFFLILGILMVVLGLGALVLVSSFNSATKELVLIPCENCKALIPQTSTFCPSCGAKPKFSPETTHAKSGGLDEKTKGILLEKYRKAGFVNPELLLEHELKRKMDEGKTTEQALQELLKEQVSVPRKHG